MLVVSGSFLRLSDSAGTPEVNNSIVIAPRSFWRFYFPGKPDRSAATDSQPWEIFFLFRSGSMRWRNYSDLLHTAAGESQSQGSAFSRRLAYRKSHKTELARLVDEIRHTSPPPRDAELAGSPGA